MNRNTHEEERRKVAEALSIARMDRLDRIVRWSVASVGQIVVSIGTLEKIRFTEVERERRNKRPVLRYFLAMMTM
ncbi:hypothetical protein T4D_1800 [Trichinella pseudospiralis]|uniref:Uncharacterized protein n=1 Tax=Trichinella pseudospiralis TaxID=6337 RepID=A0A0V1FHV4_TRIPS|nr:hypothetical protein T4D_1800 [Trichinella pseudospiralis]